MFGFGRKKETRPEDTDAYKMGQKAGDDISNAILQYRQQRFGPVFENYLNVLRDQLRKSLNDDECPPIRLARAHFQVFSDNVDELNTKMFEEMQVALSEWLRLAEVMEMRTEVEGMIRISNSTFTKELLEAGMKVIVDYATVLEDADKAWRSANPLEALKYPISD